MLVESMQRKQLTQSYCYVWSDLYVMNSMSQEVKQRCFVISDKKNNNNIDFLNFIFMIT